MPAKRILKTLGDLRLTIVLLCLAMLLVLVGTLAQVKLGIFAAQAKYFQSFFVYAEAPGGFKIPLLPGGYLVGAGLVINIICAYALRIGFKRSRIGLLLIHLGLLMLLLGQLATDLQQVESTMRLKEGERRNYSQSSRRFELAITDVTDAEFDRTTVIPFTLLKPNKIFRPEALPFSIRVHAAWPNSVNVQTNVDNHAPAATRGQGLKLKFASAPPTTRTDRRDLPSAYLELLDQGKSLGVWLASAWLSAPDTFTHQDHQYTLALRPTRYYKPYYLGLKDFSHDRYIGTDIPKNFSSLVHIENPGTGEDREVLIYMNHPLRYQGETFYQSGFDQNDPTVTILQVVRNPGWLVPYIACTIVGLGLVIQFVGHLGKSYRKRRTSQ